MNSTTRLSWRQPIALSATITSAMLALSLGAPHLQAQAAAQTPPPETGNPNANAVTNPNQAQEPVVTLSPFEVSASQDKGYYSPDTLAGTRLNNNIADLPGSIWIVTKAGAGGHQLPNHQRRVPV